MRPTFDLIFLNRVINNENRIRVRTVFISTVFYK